MSTAYHNGRPMLNGTGFEDGSRVEVYHVTAPDEIASREAGEAINLDTAPEVRRQALRCLANLTTGTAASIAAAIGVPEQQLRDTIEQAAEALAYPREAPRHDGEPRRLAREAHRLTVQQAAGWIAESGADIARRLGVSCVAVCRMQNRLRDRFELESVRGTAHRQRLRERKRGLAVAGQTPEVNTLSPTAGGINAGGAL